MLFSKEIHLHDMIELEKDIATILCQLERILPPSFFHVMVHLTIYSATEVILAGLVQFRWMYSIERGLVFKIDIIILILYFVFS